MVNLRRGLVIAGLLAFTGVWGVGAARSTDWMRLCAIVFALGDLLCAVALLRGWFWARWYALGIALVGTMQCAVWYAMNPATIREPYLVAQGIAFPVMLLALIGASMAARYDRNGSPRNPWRFDSWHVRLLAGALVLNIGTAPMLLLHACVDPWMPLAERLATLAVGLVVAIGVVAVIRQRAVGLVALALGGLGSALVGWHSLPRLVDACGCDALYQRMVDVSAVTAFPFGALGAMAALLAFAGPMIRFVRTR